MVFPAVGVVTAAATGAHPRVEAVRDLEEPNTIEFESGPEDDEPAALVFTSQATGSDGKSVKLDGAESEEQPEEGLPESEPGGEEDPSGAEDDRGAAS